MPKPELGPVKVGDRLLVIPAGYGRGPREPVPCAVTKVGRVWVELTEVTDSRPRSWKLRLGTQDAGSGYSNRDRFVTPEQYAWEQRDSAVHQYLVDVGIRPDRDSPWDSAERRIVLANLLRQHDGLPPL
jgi:hypothetical protein